MDPREFLNTWQLGGLRDTENERQGAQAYFLDLCELLQVPKPGSVEGYVFEKQTLALGQQRGYADVFYKDHFAWENKAPGKNLDAALRQLLGYSHALSNPPLLVVCDRHTLRIHTQFNGHPSETHTVRIEELLRPEKRQLLRRLWLDPESFRPKQTNRDITAQAAHSFAVMAESLRKRGPQTPPEQAAHAETVAHFLTQTLFCFFAEDVGLLPGRMFEHIVNNRYFSSQQLTNTLQKLFETMREGGPFGADYVPWFNGGLFKTVRVPKLEIIEITELRNAARLNWSAIDVSIFGTLFERGLDPAKRSQLGAHYTDPATIERIIEPVVRRPLWQNWQLAVAQIQGHMAKSRKQSDPHNQAAQQVFAAYLESLAQFKILDPACGSGNFLFLALKALKDLEHQVVLEAQALGLERPVDLVTGPANMLGIELSEYAAELARVTVWIGELQWRMEHGYPFKDNPILEPLEVIEHRDALLAWEDAQDEADVEDEGSKGAKTVEPHNTRATEANWPKASVVIGNPPFLGGSKKRRELGDAYFEALKTVYKERVPGGADLVCYWFEKARKAIETQGLGAAGLVATQSIRAGSNRKVLEAITKVTRIYEAWSDETWINEGADVRVSLVAFGWGECCFLNGNRVSGISKDLSDIESGDVSTAHLLACNLNAAFKGAEKSGNFDVPGEKARAWLASPNPHGKSNALVLKPWRNGADLTDRVSDHWVIDFGVNMPLNEAILFERPYSHIEAFVKSARLSNNDRGRRTNWWRFGRNGSDLRNASNMLSRAIATVRVAKHRFFVWQSSTISADSRLLMIARADDATFGILSSRIHEVWSLAQASMHGVGNDPTYNAKSCFETFPFPAGLTPRDTAHQRTEQLEGGACIPAELAAPTRAAAAAIAQAAHCLNALREQWLNPPEWTQRVPEVVPLGMDTSPYPDRVLPRNHLSEADLKALSQRTLTHLYNQKAAGHAQWLQAAHDQLDAAVAAAYGWPDYTPTTPDQEILKRLLALNLERAKLNK